MSARHKASAAQATARLCTPILASHSPRCAELSLLTPPLYPCQTRNHRHRWYLEPRGCPQDFLLGHCPAPLSCWHHGMAQHRGTPGASHPKQGRSSGSWEATAQFPVLSQCQQSLWHPQTDRATLLQPAPSKSWDQPGLPRSRVPALLLSIPVSVPWLSWLLCELLLSHHRPAKATRAAVGHQSSRGAQQWLMKAGHSFSPHGIRPQGLPTPSRADKGCPAWAELLCQGKQFHWGALYLQTLSQGSCTEQPCTGAGIHHPRIRLQRQHC